MLSVPPLPCLSRAAPCLTESCQTSTLYVEGRVRLYVQQPWHRSIKRYFLMDQGDFFVHFMDLTEEELRKPVEDITPTRLEALLELALRMSTANTDPFKDDLKVSAVFTIMASCFCNIDVNTQQGPVKMSYQVFFLLKNTDL